jgi:salicylate hydroxylase
MKAVSISIIGGGIGGLATAAALLKKGFEVQVYERAQALRPAGAGLILSPNGLNSLAAIDPKIVEALRQAGSEVHHLTMKRSTGEMLLTRPMAEVGRQFGQSLLHIKWSQLQSAIASALPPDIIHLNHRCLAIEQDKRGVTARFENGKVAEADLLIGADGINSVVRQALVGDGPPVYAGRMSWRALINFPHEELRAHCSTGLTGADGKNMMLFDMGEGCTCWSAGALMAEPSASEPSAVKELVLKTFAGWADPVVPIVEATPAADIVERPISDRPPLKRWSHDRMTLLGDAAHPIVPSLGQGANITFEDAYEIAEFLASSPDIETAFDRYEASRIPRTEAIYARSALQGFSSYKPDSDTTLTRQLAGLSEDEFQLWLYGYRPTPQLLPSPPAL